MLILRLFMNMGFNKIVVNALWHALYEDTSRNAFCINGTFFTYQDLAEVVSKIRSVLCDVPAKHIGLVANDDLETYASILALWFEGKCYVPLYPIYFGEYGKTERRSHYAWKCERFCYGVP